VQAHRAREPGFIRAHAESMQQGGLLPQRLKRENKSSTPDTALQTIKVLPIAENRKTKKYSYT
jgi:hypothetical protein